MRLYHGTKNTFETFAPSRGGEYGPGIYLTPDEGAARMYADRASGSGEPLVMEVHVDIGNPFCVTKQGWLRMTAGKDRGDVQKKLKAQGYDGIIATGLNGSEKQIIVFAPSQILSAIVVVYR
jgi:hypothetical protein